MKLLVFTDQMAYMDGEEYFCKNPFFLFAAKLGDYFDEVTILSCLTKKHLRGSSLVKIALNSGNRVRIQGTYPFTSVKEYYKRLFRILPFNIRVCVPAIKWADVIYLRLPAANSPLVVALARAYGKPIVAHLAADQEIVYVKTTGKYRGIQRLFALVVGHLYAFVWKHVIANSIASIFLSEELRARLAKGNSRAYTSFVSLVERTEENPRMEIPPSPHPVNLLYVGRIVKEKGLDYLLQAASMLREEGIPFRLRFCGDGSESARLEQTIRERQLESEVETLGFIPWGEAQWELYRWAHIFILPSICGEGTPKVIVEAMSRGVPVIATNVGGIPDVIKNMETGILVPHGCPGAIVDAIKLLVKDDEARRKIITNGILFAQQSTLEKQSEKIANIIYEHIPA